MEIRIIKNVPLKIGWVPKGEICKARIFSEFPLQLNPPYQVIEGKYSGVVIPREYCIVYLNEKTYTEQQWKAQEDYLIARLRKADEKTNRAQEAVRELTKQLAYKNQEIKKLTFFIEALTIGLEASSKAIEVLRSSKVN